MSPSAKYSFISHQDLPYANPIGAAKFAALIERLKLAPGAPVLDVGTGTGEFAIQLIERYGAFVTGIDLSSASLDRAREQAAGRIPEGHLALLQQDATQYQCPPAAFALVSCIGATHAFGGFTATLAHLAPLVSPGGLLLVGELYWRQEPPPAYLAAFGIPQETYVTHAENVTVGIHQGLIPLDAIVATNDEFDAYEWQRIWTLETYVYRHPADPDGPELLERIHAWRDMYLQWGRTTLGFGIYVFLRP